jgi:hypothetical protein
MTRTPLGLVAQVGGWARALTGFPAVAWGLPHHRISITTHGVAAYPHHREPDPHSQQGERQQPSKEITMINLTNTTPRKLRNETIRNHGLRQIGEKQWLDLETAKACKEMRLEMIAAREPTAQELGLFFFLREPMVKDPHFLAAAWKREREAPVLFDRYDTITDALSAMQQAFRGAQCNYHATPWSEMRCG